MCARTADMVPPTAKVKSRSKQLTRTYIEEQMEKILEIFFESSDKSQGAGPCPFCEKGQLAAMRLTDPQNLNRGGVWCTKCNFRVML